MARHARSGSGSIRSVRIVALLVLGLLALSACSTVERRPIRLAPTATAEAGLRIIVDNCPGPASVSLSVRDEVVWTAVAPAEPVETGQEELGDGTVAETTDPDAAVPEPGSDDGVEPGLLEIIVGQPPAGWTETVVLEGTLRGDTRYTVSTEPDEQSIDFAVGDLAPGLLFDGIGRSQFNQDLMMEPCSEPADVGAFVGNLAVLAALGITTAAFVLVALISLLFVITRRFGRIQTMERKARRARRQAN